MNQKGQAGDVFKLLIGVIIGLAIFIIILSLITQISSQEKYLQSEIFERKLEMAIKNPIGSEYKIDRIRINKETFINKYGLKEITGLNDSCFTFTNDSNSFGSYVEVSDIGIKFNKDLVVDLGILCKIKNATETNNCTTECEIILR